MKMDYVGKGLFKKNRNILETGLSWSRIIYIKQDYLGQGVPTYTRIILVKDYLNKT